MLCLVMKPASLDLDVLFEILKDREVDFELSSHLGAGADLAGEAIDRFDCGIAVIPPGTEHNSGARAALFIELGIAVARRVSLLVIVDPNEPPLPGLGDLMTVRATEENREALSFHVGLFLERLRRQRIQSDLWDFYDSQRAQRPALIFGPTGTGKATKISSLIQEFLATQSLRPPKRMEREADIVKFIEELLTAHGAIAQREVRISNDAGVDLAFSVPTFSETVLVEVVKGSRGTKTVSAALEQLSQYVRSSHQAIGLLLYDAPDGLPALSASANYPMVWAMSLTDFYRKVLDNQLDALLVGARNQMVHG
ncbi:hypothetical protein [Nocardia sp. NPDC020380]|uniref:hypothetical protein n=1 Tax=Nocardia sp. NPDC020380 TaxID=3364309 RepID=UPI00379952C0